MENCKLTQFKGDTNNDNLPVYNGFVVEFDCTGTSQENPRFTIGVRNGQTLKMSVVGGANRIKNYSDKGDWTNEIILSSINDATGISKSIEVSKTEKFKVIFIGKYNMHAFYSQNITIPNGCIVNIDTVEAYKNSLVTSYLNSLLRYGYVDCADFVNFRNIDNVTAISLLKGNLSLLSNLTYTSASLATNEKIQGTLKDFPSTITSINIANSTGISGDFVDLVKHQRKLGRTTGSIKIQANVNRPRITFNGNVLTDGDDTLSWDATTITWAGETISNSDVEP